MGKQPFISHAVNGYSRYDVPESKAFSCTPGLLYPVRLQFVNARDRISISQGIDVRSNPLAVPTFNPYTVRLHRFWVPMQLYHPEMRTNSSKFDMNNISLNWIPSSRSAAWSSPWMTDGRMYSNSLLSWLRICGTTIPVVSANYPYAQNDLHASSVVGYWSNADTYLAYWDIVRNYYSYSNWGVYSFAWPSAWKLVVEDPSVTFNPNNLVSNSANSYFTQTYGNLEFLDAYYESQFYPSAVSTTNNTFNRSSLFHSIVASDITLNNGAAGMTGYEIRPGVVVATPVGTKSPSYQTTSSLSGTNPSYEVDYFLAAHPMAVVPSAPDRFTRLMPSGPDSSVSMGGVSTIPQLAIASRLQEYKDLLGAGGNRFSDWLETFFASKIEHVDRPKLLFAASQTVNCQVVMNQSGTNMFQAPDVQVINNPLGQQGGAIAFNTMLGRKQSYYFREPGYLIDMLSIRPVYYWTGIRPDYLDYKGADYFNPIYNDIGYQSVSMSRFGIASSSALSVANEPCFNEFRSSYDEVLGSFIEGISENPHSLPLYKYWVQQNNFAREFLTRGRLYYSTLFTNLSSVNDPFASSLEDNFFVNLSYSVQLKNLVNKTFATRLSNR
ncbi:MAG: major capsid protein [Chaetfec virus UA24_2231]|nr:MAG: major capsid protein [Chaetfec virus UA24_2231]